MKNYIKNTWVSYVISLVLSFMLFIIEPINLYASNLNDFWFDLNILLKPSIIIFIISFVGVSLISNLIYIINKKVFKIYNVILFIGFVCTYIQGNFLAGNLPVLSGDIINWSNYFVDSIISVILWVVVIIASIIICKKVKIDNYVKYSGYVTLAVFIMLSVSLISTFLTTNLSANIKKDSIYSATFDNFNNYSDSENLIIFLLDAVDSKHFDEAIKKNSEFSNTLKDFTYFPDTMSVHPFTQESIPLILTGNIYENQEEFNQYAFKSMNSSPLLNNLLNNNYDINIYESELPFNDDSALKINNVNSNNEKIKYNVFMRQELKYIMFRYLPFFIKKYSSIESMNFTQDNIIDSEEEYFVEDNFEVLEHINKEFTKEHKKQFKFIHLDGAHVAFNTKKDLSRSDNATYMDEVEACLHITDIYLNKLKENNVYDNTSIVIMADHGYNYSGSRSILEGRQNPILYVKGFNETHDSMSISEKQISFNDLQGLYSDLINGKNSNEVFENIGNNRIRKFLLYTFEDTNHMDEYETKDKAWETDKLYKTGQEFILK